jgi:hypothetical protein
VSVKAEERVMASERIAPGMLPRVLNSFDMCGVSALAAVVIYAISELAHRTHAAAGDEAIPDEIHLA